MHSRPLTWYCFIKRKGNNYINQKTNVPKHYRKAVLTCFSHQGQLLNKFTQIRSARPIVTQVLQTPVCICKKWALCETSTKWQHTNLDRKNVLCSTHEGKQLPHCWAYMTTADHIATYMLLLVISTITILEVQTNIASCTPSLTTETILKRLFTSTCSNSWQTTKQYLFTLQNCTKRSLICLQAISNKFWSLISLYRGNHARTSEEITAGFISVSYMHLKCNISKIWSTFDSIYLKKN